jgi:hypothetical protein
VVLVADNPIDLLGSNGCRHKLLFLGFPAMMLAKFCENFPNSAEGAQFKGVYAMQL